MSRPRIARTQLRAAPTALVLCLCAIAGLARADEEVRVLRCPQQHTHQLGIRAVGFEHVSHHLTIDRTIAVREFTDGFWFVESARCAPTGFIVTASRRQYGDPMTRQFRITPDRHGGYAIR